MTELEIVKPGLRTTVEDLGRRRVARWGVPPGGAFDALALEAANLLAGNPREAAGLEWTLRGPELSASDDLVCALVGADFGARVVDGSRALTVEHGRAFTLPRGARLDSGYATGGARAWLAVAGGIEVPPVLGSRSTEVPSGFGGFQGRALRAGDRLLVGHALFERPRATYEDPVRLSNDEPNVLRVLPGPQLAELPRSFAAALAAAVFSVENDSSRAGVRLRRLSGAELPAAPREMEPEGTAPGAVQLTGGTEPIILGVDRPVTGGYPKPAVVVAADLGLVARLAPGMRVAFRFVESAEAHRANAERRWPLADLQR